MRNRDQINSVRIPAVAGSFYPAAEPQLRAELKELLDQAQPPQLAGTLKALIVPHAGYIYSGPIAASAYLTLKGIKQQFKRVVLLGPSHRVPLEGLAASPESAFETPLGLVPLDRQAIQSLVHDGLITLDKLPHKYEHSLEVQLPFLQTVLDNFELVPLTVGDSSDTRTAEVLNRFWNSPDTLIVISSDLSHYESYDEAQRHDLLTANHIAKLEFKNLQPEDACGCVPVRGLLKLVSEKNGRVQLLDLRNSGDTAGDKDEVVGYGSFAVTTGEAPLH